MSITFTCQCGKAFRGADESVGKNFRCPACGTVGPIRPIASSDSAAAPQLSMRSPASKPNWLEWLLMKNTISPTPGRLRVHFPTYMRSYPLVPLMILAYFIFACAMAAFSGQKSALALPPITVVFMLAYLLFVWLYMRNGDLNPGKVVSVDSYMIAVATNMDGRNTDRSWVVKILRHPLNRMTGGPPQLGTHLATVSTYEGNANAGRWKDFCPRVANCVSNDEKVIAEVFGRISPSQIRLLNLLLEQVPQPYRPGLYSVSLSKAGFPCDGR